MRYVKVMRIITNHAHAANVNWTDWFGLRVLGGFLNGHAPKLHGGSLPEEPVRFAVSHLSLLANSHLRSATTAALASWW